MKRLPWQISGAIVGGAFLALAIVERKRRLRLPVEPGLRRVARNMAVAGISAALAAVAHAPVAGALTSVVERRRWGIVQRLGLSPAATVVAALLLTDYSYYLWHVALHRWPLLWRVHVAHHSDLDLDTTTALRFHFGEVVATIPLTAAQILAVGLTPWLFSIWQVWFAVCVLFHHADVCLPLGWERPLSRVLMTPRLHGIHHSVVPGETNSNWSSGLAIWDVLHGTWRADVPQPAITIGVPEYRTPDEVTLGRVLAMPFVFRESTDVPVKSGEAARRDAR